VCPASAGRRAIILHNSAPRVKRSGH
jgi:hypothetical protein